MKDIYGRPLIPKWPDIKRYCKKCKDYTFHTEHGFPGSNYRQVCSICGSENYTRDGF
jgi:ribosomal protein L33